MREYVLIAAALFFLIASKVVPPTWQFTHARRRAVKLALDQFHTLGFERQWSSGGWVNGGDQLRIFVVLVHKAAFRPAPLSVFAVWRDSPRVDEVATSQFAWGIKIKHAISEYERTGAKVTDFSKFIGSDSSGTQA
jgi:hypothetical protein